MLGFNATDDAVHGHQEDRFFHRYYDHDCFLSLDVFAGDRIRWMMVRDQLGDTPQAEAVVESIAGNVRFPGMDQVMLKVIRSWGMESPPEPDTTIRQGMIGLFLRGCVRVPWHDEEKRTERVLQAEQEARTRGQSQGLSM